ncbi:MAG: ABC transporter permease subunit [Kiritimatiellae bacterium]|nr:ABC transporter permease subunit [Kiritimatiellia bacterium]
MRQFPSKQSVLGVALAIAIIGGWVLLSAGGRISPSLLPAPWTVAKTLADEWNSGKLSAHLLATTSRVLSASAVGAAISTLIAGLCLLFPSWAGTASRLADFLRSVPVLALYPLFLLLLGPGPHTIVSSAAWIVALILVSHMIHGLQAARVQRLEFYRLLGLSNMSVLFWLRFPEALPSLLSGLRIALSLAFAVVVALEMLTTPGRGLGQQVYEASLLFRTAILYAYIMLTGAVGMMLNLVTSILETRVVHWRGH